MRAIVAQPSFGQRARRIRWSLKKSSGPGGIEPGESGRLRNRLERRRGDRSATQQADPFAGGGDPENGIVLGAGILASERKGGAQLVSAAVDEDDAPLGGAGLTDRCARPL